jgi:hypothetical protein
MRKISKALNRIVVAALIALLTASLLPSLNVRAYDDISDIEPATSINLNHLGKLTVKHIDADEKLAPGVESKIYLVATVDEKGIYTITDDFKGFFEDLDFFNNGFNYDQWKECVVHTDEGNSNTGAMETYIKEKGIEAVASGTSDDNGETLYSNLTLGIYFVESGTYEKSDGFLHTFINFLYPVPILQKKDGQPLEINYHPTASPKKARTEIDVHCGIKKQWDDSSSNNRPATVSFRVYVDGVEAEWSPITLSSENDWQYNWTDKGNPKYTVEEINNPEGYRPEITLKQVGPHEFIYTCVNHYSGDNPPPPPDNPPPDNPPPDNPPPTNPPSNPPGFPGLPAVLGAVRALPQVLGARRLPQTGQLWWPLPILVIAGIFFIVKGIKKNAKIKAQNN